MPTKPTTYIDEDSQFFWDATVKHQLMLQKCEDCGVVRHPPSPSCRACRSLRWSQLPASGNGVVYSYAIPRHPQSEIYGSGYVVALIELDEGVRYLANIRECDPSDVHIGDRVTVFFEPFDGTYLLPQFRLTNESGTGSS